MFSPFLNRLACVEPGSLLPAPLGVTGMLEVEVLTAILLHPKIACQPKDRQTEHTEEELKPKRGGKSIPYFAVNTDYLHHLVAGHHQASQHRDEHRPFSLDEYGRCGE